MQVSTFGPRQEQQRLRRHPPQELYTRDFLRRKRRCSTWTAGGVQLEKIPVENGVFNLVLQYVRTAADPYGKGLFRIQYDLK